VVVSTPMAPEPTVPGTTGETSKMEALASTVQSLPTLPSIVSRVVEVTNNPNATANDLAKVILTDPAATAKILRIANSAYYSFAKRISTITEAIVVLGLDTVRNTLLTVFYQTMHQDLQRQKGNPKVLELWRHSLCTALVARNLAGSQDVSFREKCYVAGLLHDIGRLVLLSRDPAKAGALVDEAVKTKRTLEEIETERLGFTHGQLGSAVARHWRLPPEICEAIGQHHQAGPTPDPKLAAIVHVATYLVTASKVGAGEGLRNDLNAGAKDLVGLDESRIGAILDSMDDVLKEADTLSGLAR